MKTTFQLVVLGREGMYTYGGESATPELAKINVGGLIRDRCNEGLQRLGIERHDWDNNHNIGKPTRRVLIDAEKAPGEWKIG